MSESNSLLNKIKSKYILQKILSNSYGDIKSLLKLFKYNKNSLTKLGINIKDFYKFKTKTKIIKSMNCRPIILIHLIVHIIIFIILMIFIIKFFTKGKFIYEIILDQDDLNNKNFIIFIDKYILCTAISIFLIILLCLCNIFYLK